MSITVASEELRTAAKSLCFNVEDLIPVPGKNRRWRVPMQKLKEKPELGNFMQLYFKNEYPRVLERIESQGLRVKSLRGPDLLYIGGDFFVELNEILIYVRCPNPQEPAAGNTENVKGKDTSTSGRAAPKSPLNSGAFEPSDLASPEIQQGASISYSMASQQQHLQSNEDVLLQLLRQELKVGVKYRHNNQRPTEPLALGMGDQLELHELQDLNVTAGVFPALTMGIEVARIPERYRSGERPEVSTPPYPR